MSVPDERETVEFFGHVMKLKALKRTGWLRYDIKDPESVSAHTYGVAMLAWLFSREHDVDISKVLKMALVHDLGEALAGDLTPYDKEYKRESLIVAEKLKEIVAKLPPDLQHEVTGLYSELCEKKTTEAKIVEMADDLDRLLTALHYQQSGADLREFFDVEGQDFTESGRSLLKYLKSLGNSE